MKVGSHAAETREPGQAREGAAISGIFRAPWGSPAGAPKKGAPRSGNVEGGRAAHFYLSMSFIEILVEVLVGTILISIALYFTFHLFNTINIARKNLIRIMEVANAINFIRDEIRERSTGAEFILLMKDKIKYTGFSNGREKVITYYVKKVDKEWRIYRKADGEGHNVILRSRKPLSFDKDNRLAIIIIGKDKYYLPMPYPHDAP